MTKVQSSTMAANAVLVALLGCSPDDGQGSRNGSDTQGTSGAGGSASGTGGSSSGTGGSSSGTGGSASGGTSETGGVLSTGGGGALGTGGISSTGGASATGGRAPGSGGSPFGGGGIASSGGTTTETGGVQESTGGTQEAGGSTAGGTGPATGGHPGTAGDNTGGTPAIDPSTSAAINACMDQLPWGAPDLSADERAPIVSAIFNACAAFAPPGAEWQTYCQMFLVAAINAESSYDVLAGSVGAGDDPTIGLLQIRFSSTVRDFVDYGPVGAMATIGCDFGTVTDSDSYATKSEMMLDPSCNVALGLWYYMIFGSGNGGSEVVWVSEYCRGRGGVAGNLHIGMACHLMGAEAAHSSIEGADFYYDQIKTWFEPCVTYTGTHPFELTIEPDRDKYCR